MKKISFLLAVLLLFAALTSCAGEDAAVDAPVYSSRELYGDVVFYKVNESALRRSLLSETNKWYEACTDPLCSHDKEGVCPAFAGAIPYTLILPREGGVMPLVYMFSLRPIPIERDGKVLEYIGDTKHCRVKVFDTATGESRELTTVDFARANGAWYTGGKIYLSVEYRDGEYPSNRVGMMDAETGEYTEIEGLQHNTEGVGISGGRFYFISEDGILHSSSLSLGDVRDEYDCGVGKEVRMEHEMTAAYVDSGMLYFEKNCRIPEEIDNEDFVLRNFLMVSDVYCVDLGKKGAKETLVAENVREFKPYNGDLYYAVWNYEERGEVECPDEFVRSIIVTDDGTLYRYNHTDGTSAAVVENCGTGFYRLNDISDRYVMFEGMQYDNLDEFIYERTTSIYYFLNKRCVLDLETGEWRVVNNTYMADDENLDMFR